MFYSSTAKKSTLPTYEAGNMSSFITEILECLESPALRPLDRELREPISVLFLLRYAYAYLIDLY